MGRVSFDACPVAPSAFRVRWRGVSFGNENVIFILLFCVNKSVVACSVVLTTRKENPK